MKLFANCAPNAAEMSLPVRGAWVEIDSREFIEALSVGRSPCGERGLKLE